MTLSSTTPREIKNGNGTATVFSFTFVINQATDLVVTYVDSSNNETVLSEGTGTTNYSVSVSSYPGTGSVTYPAALGTELATGEQLIIQRVVDLDQDTDLINQGAWKPEQVENTFDYSRMIDLQQQDELDRSIKSPASTPLGTTYTLPAPESLALFRWNEAATDLEAVQTADLVTTANFSNFKTDTFVDGVDFTAGTTTQVTLDSAPGTISNTQVYFDGVYQAKSNYSLAASVLTFDVAIPLGVATVEVVHGKAADVLAGSTREIQQGDDTTTVFTLANSYEPGNGTLHVYINGVRQEVGYGYTETNATTVTFDAPPLTGDIVLFLINPFSTQTTIDASNVTYTAAVTGASARNVQARLSERVSVKDFGATGDGVTDDTAAIQAALNLAGTVIIPDGNFLCNSQLTVKSNTTVLCRGTLLKGYDSGVNSLTDALIVNENYAADPTFDSNITFDGLTIRNDLSTDAGAFLSLNWVDGLVIRNFDFLKTAEGWCSHICGKDIRITDGTVDTTAASQFADALHFEYAEDVVVSNVVMRTQDDCLAFFYQRSTNASAGPDKTSKNIAVSNCVMFSEIGNGIRIGGGEVSDLSCPVVANGYWQGVAISNCVIDQDGASGTAIQLWDPRIAYANKSTDILLDNIRINDSNSSDRIIKIIGNQDETSATYIAERNFGRVTLQGLVVNDADVGNCIYAGGTESLVVDGLEYTTSAASGGSTIETRQVDDVAVRDCVFETNTTAQVIRHDDFQTVRCLDSVFVGSGTEFSVWRYNQPNVTSGDTVEIRGNRVLSGHTRGAQPLTSTALDRLYFRDNDTSGISSTVLASSLTYSGGSVVLDGGYSVNVNVLDYGAKGDGTTDDTAAIEAAWDFCLSTSNGSFPAESGELAAFIVNGPSLYFPAGDYVYNGTGLDSTTNTAFRLHGEGSSNTRIKITAGSYLIDLDNRYLNHMTIQDIHFEGGAGVFRNSYTSNNVAGQYVVKDCFFSNYTDCAVGHNSVDMPRWYFENNMFNGTTTSIGIALQGLANGSVITRNWFGTNLYGIKLGYGGPDVKIAFNEFVHRAAGGGSPDFVNIWVVPSATSSGFKGPTIFSNKFGNENLSAGDYRILFADEGTTVTDFLDTPHSVSASTGYIEAVTTYDNQFSGNSGYTRPYIVSYTPNVRHCKWGQDFFLGTYSSGGWVSFPAASLTEDRNRQSIIEIGPSQGGMNKLGPRLFPDGNMGYVSDPLGYHAGEHDVPNHFTAGGASSDFTNLLSSNNLVTDGSVTNATRAGITDSMGGTNAIELTLTAASGRVNLNGIAANVVANRHAWIELDLLKSTTTPLSDIYFDIYRDSVTIAMRRFVLLPDEWKTIRIPWVPTQTYSTNLQIRIIGSGYSAGVATNFKVGRPRIYHSSEPVNFGRLSGGVSQTTVGAAGSASALPATPEGYQTIVVDGTEYVMPYYAKS